MFTVLRTEYFEKWYSRLKDNKAKARIDMRIQYMELGTLGDVKSVGDGISEARIHYGPGYRLYFYQKENVLIIMLCGGDKTTQRKDIETAKEIKKCL